MKKHLLLIALFGSFVFTQCSGEDGTVVEKPHDKEINSEIETPVKRVQTEEDKELLNQVIQSMPSPLETSFAIKESGYGYNSVMLNPIENIEKYASDSKKALNMGVYGTDLGYINIYAKQMHVVNYMACIKTLAEELSVGHFFDLEAIGKMSENSEDMDALIMESTKSYNEMDDFLRDQDRGNISVLMALGAWTEGIHVLSQVYKQTKDAGLREKVAEQGIVIDLVAMLLDMYAEESQIKKLHPAFNEIVDAYSKVETIETEGETITEEINGELVFTNTGTTEIKITEEDLDTIITKIETLRKMIIE